VFAAMQPQEKPPVSVHQLCKLLGVNRRWYYQCRKQNKRAEADEKLREVIEQIVLELAGYGYRRLTQALVLAGWSVNNKHVLRVMREASLLCRKKYRFVHMADSQHPYRSIRIWSKAWRSPPQIRCGWPISPTSGCQLRLSRLSAILDAYSRKCVAWKLSKRIDGQLALDALDMALAVRDGSPGLIHHSNRGITVR
jgi:putative transposase